MPVRDEGAFFEKSLGSVLAQDYPSDRLEIIVADGMSVDGTRERLQSIASTQGLVTVIDNPGRIVPTGLNAALRRARGDVIVRVDGHCEIASDYVRACVQHLLAGEAEGVGGSIETVGETPTARAIAAAMSSRFGVGGSAFRTMTDRTLYVDTIPFPAYKRAAMATTGPFDEELVRNQDDEYNYRLRANGGRLLLARDVRSRYHSRTSFRRLWRQYFQYGFWKVRVLQKHPKQMQPRQFAPPAFVGVLLLLAAGASFLRFARWGLVAVSFAYAAANISASTVLARRLSVSVWRVALAFGLLHVSYGIGFLAGLARFWSRWNESSPTATPSPFAAPPTSPHMEEP